MSEEKRDDGLLFKLRPRAGVYDEDALRSAIESATQAATDVRAQIGRTLLGAVAAFDASRLAVASVDSASALRAVGAMLAAITTASCAFAEQVERASLAIEDAIRSMPEEEREELRRAIEDAPLEEVDVNASDRGAM